jgi:hypothetical protein
VIFTLSLCIRNFAVLTRFSRISAKIHELLGVSTVSDISAALGVAVVGLLLAALLLLTRLLMSVCLMLLAPFSSCPAFGQSRTGIN